VTAQTAAWLVVRQHSDRPDEQHSRHRWQLAARLSARRATRRATEFGVFYDVRRAERGGEGGSW
jgi:hypothetical protein